MMFADLALAITVPGWVATTATTIAYRRRLHTDPLTGIGNRAALHHRARRAARRSGLVGLLMVDLDRFKAINDTHGHDFGNKVLATVAAHLTDATEWGELAVRLHGDEFAVWLGHLPRPEHAEERAGQITQALAAPVWVDGRRITALGSVGVAIAPARTPLADLLSEADVHMYAVKHARHLDILPVRTTPRPRDTTPGGEAA